MAHRILVSAQALVTFTEPESLSLSLSLSLTISHISHHNQARLRLFSFSQSSDPFTQSRGVIGREGVQSSVPDNMYNSITQDEVFSASTE